MRHAILVVGSKAQASLSPPTIVMTDNEAVRMSTWYANAKQDSASRMLDDERSLFLRVMLAPVLAYRFYNLVHNTKLWGGKRPLVLVRGRSLAIRIAAYAGTWGGGDVVKADQGTEPPLRPTRFVLDVDGKLRLHAQ